MLFNKASSRYPFAFTHCVTLQSNLIKPVLNIHFNLTTTSVRTIQFEHFPFFMRLKRSTLIPLNMTLCLMNKQIVKFAWELKHILSWAEIGYHVRTMSAYKLEFSIPDINILLTLKGLFQLLDVKEFYLLHDPIALITLSHSPLAIKHYTRGECERVLSTTVFNST